MLTMILARLHYKIRGKNLSGFLIEFGRFCVVFDGQYHPERSLVPHQPCSHQRAGESRRGDWIIHEILKWHFIFCSLLYMPERKHCRCEKGRQDCSKCTMVVVELKNHKVLFDDNPLLPLLYGNKQERRCSYFRQLFCAHCSSTAAQL